MTSTGYVAILLAYSGGLVALGLYLSRRVHSTNDFFVAGRQLSPGLIFATFLAANIGAGSTVGASGRGKLAGLEVGLLKLPLDRPFEIRRPGGLPCLAFQFLLRWSTSLETPGRFWHLVTCAHIAPDKPGAATPAA